MSVASRLKGLVELIGEDVMFSRILDRKGRLEMGRKVF